VSRSADNQVSKAVAGEIAAVLTRLRTETVIRDLPAERDSISVWCGAREARAERAGGKPSRASSRWAVNESSALFRIQAQVTRQLTIRNVKRELRVWPLELHYSQRPLDGPIQSFYPGHTPALCVVKSGTGTR
jgi:hypothetical protein